MKFKIINFIFTFYWTIWSGLAFLKITFHLSKNYSWYCGIIFGLLKMNNLPILYYTHYIVFLVFLTFSCCGSTEPGTFVEPERRLLIENFYNTISKDPHYGYIEKFTRVRMLNVLTFPTEYEFDLVVTNCLKNGPIPPKDCLLKAKRVSCQLMTH